MAATENKLALVLSTRDQEITDKWLKAQTKSGKKVSAAEQAETERVSKEFIAALKRAVQSGSIEDITGAVWNPIKELLSDLSGSRAKAGYTPSETAMFIYSVKPLLSTAIQEECTKSGVDATQPIMEAGTLLDKLGLITIEAFQRTREELISRQQEELLELSTPVIRLWDNVLALPLIGTLDSSRTQIVMQNLLEAIVQTRSDYAIIDITAVPIVDTLVAQHLLKTVAAARLMGADCLISGMRPQIAQTIIHLGVDLSNVTTKATLADAFAVALKRDGKVVVSKENVKTAAN